MTRLVGGERCAKSWNSVPVPAHHRRMKRLSISLSALLLCLSGLRDAHAGDPCPVSFEVHDFGSPSWLDRDQVLSNLKSSRGWLGISYRDKKDGVTITQIFPGSPALKAGIQRGDIIKSVAGTAVSNQKQVNRAFDRFKPGDTIKMQVVRAGKPVNLSFQYARRDPLLFAMVEHMKGHDDCTDIDLKPNPDVDAKRFKRAIFGNGKRFQCTSAHRRLAKLFDDHHGDGMIVAVRGRKRVLLSLVGWKTICIKSASVDGEKLSKKNVQSVFNRLTSAFVADRYANP